MGFGTDDFLTTTEAARRLGCSPGTVRRAIRDGRLKATRLGPSGWLRIPAQSLDTAAAEPHSAPSSPRNPGHTGRRVCFGPPERLTGEALARQVFPDLVG